MSNSKIKTFYNTSKQSSGTKRQKVTVKYFLGYEPH